MACKLCEKPVVARGLCRPHYAKLKKLGTLSEYPTTTVPIEDRIRSKFTVTADGCWQWTGNFRPDGYGMVWRSGISRRAHRETYEVFREALKPTDILCHACDNRGCVNPGHMFIGTRKDNILDAVSKGRHAFGERNGHAKLSSDQICEIRSSALSQAKLASNFGVCQSTVSRIKGGLRRRRG